jgi:uncharacterized membrane-anchored protein
MMRYVAMLVMAIMLAVWIPLAMVPWLWEGPRRIIRNHIFAPLSAR